MFLSLFCIRFHFFVLIYYLIDIYILCVLGCKRIKPLTFSSQIFFKWPKKVSALRSPSKRRKSLLAQNMHGDGKSFISTAKPFGDGTVCVMRWDLFCSNNFVSSSSKPLTLLYEAKMELFKNLLRMRSYTFNTWRDSS